MRDQQRPDHADPRDDLPDPARCVLLDDYWAELQSQSEPDSLSWLSDRDLWDHTIAADLDVLNRLNQLRQSSPASGDPSQPKTLEISERFDLGPVTRASDQGRPAEGDHDPDRSGDRGAGLALSARQAGAPATSPKTPAASPAFDSPEPGAEGTRRIGKYLVIELLATGGQSQVFRVLHPELGKDFVLKLGRRPIADGPNGRERLLQEGRLLARHDDHPNLVRVVDLDAHQGRPFVVMEHVAGLTLEQFASQHRVGPRQAARLVAELAKAVAYLHARGIVHQDIKPQNVLVDHRARPRLIDFGLARWTHAWSDDPADWIGGTAGYMSPEQALGRADLVGPWTDVFGLGSLLYHLLTGRPLYQGASRISVLRQAREAGYVPVRQVKKSVPRALERICHKALAADPERRYHTAQALERTLKRYLARRWVAAAGLIVLAIIAVSLFAPRLRPAEWERSGNPPPVATVPRLTITPIVVEHSRGDPARPFGPIHLSSQPILFDDDVRVSARLDTPGYFYLIALNPDGKVKLCLPSRASEPPPRSAAIDYPSDESKFFPLNDGSGLQAFVVVAARQSLPQYEKWEGSTGLRQRWKSTDAQGVWRCDGQRPWLASSVPRGEPRERSGYETPARFQEICEYLKNLPGIEAVEAIAFPVRPKAKEQAEARPELPWQPVLEGAGAQHVEAPEKTTEQLEEKGQFAETITSAFAHPHDWAGFMLMGNPN